MIPAPLADALTLQLGAPVSSERGASGGCINEAAVIRAGGDRFFLKWNRRCPPSMLSAEARGLQRLRAGSPLRVPEPLAWSDGTEDIPGYLLMELIEPGGPGSDYGRALGAGLATQHADCGGVFGLEHDNYIGSLPQANRPSSDWASFFAEQRLLAQLRLAVDSGVIRASDQRAVDAVITRMDELVPGDPPRSLLHGDLWGGNHMADGSGRPVIYDPAIYVGHAEVELAFTELFGGFDRAFYRSYEEVAGISDAYRSYRRDLYNVYPLLVHANLFGGGYGRQAGAAAARALAEAC